MEKLRIAIAFDNVVANVAKLYALVAERFCERRISWEYFSRDYVIGRGWLMEEEYAGIEKRAWSQWSMQVLESMPGAQYYLELLTAQTEYELFIITSHTKGQFLLLDEWLEKNGLNFTPRIGVHSISNRELFLQALDADVYVSADSKDLIKWAGAVKRPLLFPWAYNRYDNLPSKIERIRNVWPGSSWENVYHSVKEISAAKQSLTIT